MPNQGPSCKSGDPKADSSLPCPLLPLAHSVFQYENPMLLGMCQQNPDLSYQPPAFLCMQSARSPLMAPWQGFLCLSCSMASSSVTISKRLTTRVPWGGLSPSAHQKSLPPLFSPLPCSPSAPQEGSGALWTGLWSLKALLPRGKSAKGSGKK